MLLKELFHIERNLVSNYRFIKNMLEHGLNDMSITGTCFEYGLQNGSLHEDMETKPVTNYGLAKDCLRKFMQSMKNDYRFSFKWLRLFYLFGPGQGTKSLYSQMMNIISEDNKEFNMSPGDQIRDFLSVETMAEYIVTVALQNDIDGIINYCSGKPVSIRNFAENFFKQHNYPVKLNPGYYPYPEHEPLAFWGNTDKLKKF